MSTYNITLSNGVILEDIPDNVMLQMLQKLPVITVERWENGETLYSKPAEPAVKPAKVGGITIARDWMVAQTFIKPDGDTESYITENQTKGDACSWLRLAHDTEGLEEYNRDMGELLSTVVIFEKIDGCYVQRGRVDL